MPNVHLIEAIWKMKRSVLFIYTYYTICTFVLLRCDFGLLTRMKIIRTYMMCVCVWIRISMCILPFFLFNQSIGWVYAWFKLIIISLVHWNRLCVYAHDFFSSLFSFRNKNRWDFSSTVLGTELAQRMWIEKNGNSENEQLSSSNSQRKRRQAIQI